MKTLLTYCVLFAIIATASCKKEDTPSVMATVTFAKEALAYAQLPLNRYFIYKDSATGGQDSIVVTTSDLTTFVVPARAQTFTSSWILSAQPAYNAQKFMLVLTQMNGTKTSWYNAGDIAYDESNLSNLPSSDLHALELIGYDNFVGSASDLRNIGFSYNPKIFPDVLQSLSIEGNNYNNVLRYTATVGNDSDSTQSWYYKSTYYWVKGTGIVKRIEKNNKGTFTSNLVRYGG